MIPSGGAGLMEGFFLIPQNSLFLNFKKKPTTKA